LRVNRDLWLSLDMQYCDFGQSAYTLALAACIYPLKHYYDCILVSFSTSEIPSTFLQAVAAGLEEQFDR
jgi:hypothetical protein